MRQAEQEAKVAAEKQAAEAAQQLKLWQVVARGEEELKQLRALTRVRRQATLRL